ncbi:molecular chaperone DnaK [Maritimibacter sp. 55A14]|uniref:TraR/DksA family transcriptional regulator n=1 Tax=Maritimibacter sp. 55A14 TaxID=2174844 RepID=UPI000D60EED9|nr:TraR/DksA family transcriptional regulator [Maritimibacter sp. 55A14]PWE30659.1 molecular chaperone DnaK [Maritimibacter sp. 55A14]
MTVPDDRLAAFRTRLHDMLAELSDQDKAAEGSRDTVALDQQSVGRLSRMDAMQQQAMANATHARRQQMILRIRAALSRLDAGEFGYCEDCGEEIAPGRLDLDPTVTRCVSCASG